MTPLTALPETLRVQEGKRLDISHGPGQSKIVLPMLDFDNLHTISFQAKHLPDIKVVLDNWSVHMRHREYFDISGRGHIFRNEDKTIIPCSWIWIDNYTVSHFQQGTVEYWLKHSYGQKRRWDILDPEPDMLLGAWRNIEVYDRMERRLCRGAMKIIKWLPLSPSLTSLEASIQWIGYYTPLTGGDPFSAHGMFHHEAGTATLIEL